MSISSPSKKSHALIQNEHASAKPRVLFVLGTLWGENGITTHMLTLAKGLINNGWTVALASGLANDIEGASEEAKVALERFELNDIPAFVISFPKIHLSINGVIKVTRALRELNKVVNQFQPDVIHLHSLSVCPYIQIIRLLHSIPFVSTCHAEPDGNRVGVKFSGLAGRHLKTLFGKRLIAVSSALVEAYQTIMNVPKENIRLIYHGVDPNQFRPPTAEEQLKAHQSFGLDDHDKVICLVGRLSPAKGHRLLIEALAILQHRGVDAIVLCAGKGYADEENQIRKLASQLEVFESVRFLGMTDTRQVLWASDILVLPSRPNTEAFGLVVSEAMLCGVVPIRTPAAGAIDQIDEGKNGFIVPFDDAETLALRLSEVLANPELQARLAAAAIATAHQKFTVNQMVESTIAVYEEILNHPESSLMQ